MKSDIEKIDQLIVAGGPFRDLAICLLEGMGWSDDDIQKYIDKKTNNNFSHWIGSLVCINYKIFTDGIDEIS